MKFASLILIAVSLLFTMAVVAGAWMTLPPPIGMATARPVAEQGLTLVSASDTDSRLPPRPAEPDRPLMWPNEFAVLSVTGIELIEAMLAQENSEDATAPERDRSRLSLRTPERQARGLSGSA